MLIQNPVAAQVIRDQAKLTITEGFPQNLLANVQPVMDMTPRFHRTATAAISNSTGSGNSAVFTTSTNADTFITGATWGIVKDATCDLASGGASLTATQDGKSITLLTLPVLTLTAQSLIVSQVFNPPIKVDRNITLRMNQTFTVGTLARSANIHYYEVQ